MTSGDINTDGKVGVTHSRRHEGDMVTTRRQY